MTLFLCIALFAVMPFSAIAQLGIVKGDVTLKIFPENPRGMSDVTATLESFSTDLNRAQITWFKDGKTVKNGIGEKSFSFKTGKVGTVTTIAGVIKTSEGATVEKTLTVRPVEVDIVWQASSYTPPFYKGKALYSAQSNIKIIALPNFTSTSGGIVDSNKLLYTWSQDGKVLGGISGYGKDSYSFAGSILAKPLQIGVEVTDINSSAIAKDDFVLINTEPKILLYEDNPVFGIQYEKALVGMLQLMSQEIKITAAPYFFSTEDVKTSATTFNWGLNASPFPQQERKESVVLRQIERSAGTSLISLDVSNARKILQGASTKLTIQLNGEVETSSESPF